LWDTAGQERYRTIMNQYYRFFVFFKLHRGVNAVIFMFDITNRASFENVLKWMNSMESNTSRDDYVAKILVGNKVDQESLRRVTFEEAKNFAFDQSCGYVEISAKEDIKVDEVFDLILKLMLENE
jgi:small GTP-binding protein